MMDQQVKTNHVSINSRAKFWNQNNRKDKIRPELYLKQEEQYIETKRPPHSNGMQVMKK